MPRDPKLPKRLQPHAGGAEQYRSRPRLNIRKRARSITTTRAQRVSGIRGHCFVDRFTAKMVDSAPASGDPRYECAGADIVPVVVEDLVRGPHFDDPSRLHE